MLTLQNNVLKIIIFLLLLTPLYGQHIVAHAESVNGTVSDYFTSKEKKTEDKVIEKKQDKNIETNKETNGSVITFMDVAKMIFALIFVVALLYFLLKFINKKSRSYQQNRMIQNFGGTPLGGNRSLQIVKAGNRILILGVGEDIHLLKEIDNQKEVDEFIQYYEDQLNQSLEPKDLVSKLANGIKNRKKNEQADHADSFQNILKDQLSHMKKERNNALNKLDKKESKTDE